MTADCVAAGCSTDTGVDPSSVVPVEKKKAMFGFPLPNMLDDPACKAVIGKVRKNIADF